MWGFAHFAKNMATHTYKASAHIIKQSCYTPIQKIWANMYQRFHIGKLLPFKVVLSVCPAYQL